MCQPKSQCGSLPGGCGAAGGRSGGEGLPLQPKGNILAGMLSLGPTWWAHHPFLHKQTIHGAEPSFCMEPKGTHEHPGPLWLWRLGSWPGLPARMERGQVGHHRVKKGLPAQAGRQAGQTRAGKFSLWEKKKIIKSCKLTVHICHSDPSPQNLRQQRTETKAGIS